MDIQRVTPEHIVPALQAFAREFDRALIEHSEGERTIQDYFDLLVASRAQLWVAAEPGKLVAMAITRLVDYPQFRRLSFDLLVGKDLAKLFPLFDHIAAWAVREGAQQVEAWVRPGLRRALEPLGFRRSYEIVVKDLK